MVFVFGSFMLEDTRTVKILGLGLAATVAIDATVIRMLLVPATMELLGDRNWWIPRSLDLLPTWWWNQTEQWPLPKNERRSD